MSSAEYSCKLFEPIFVYRQTVWSQIRLLLEGPHCLQKWLLKSQADDKADDNSCDWQFKGYGGVFDDELEIIFSSSVQKHMLWLIIRSALASNVCFVLLGLYVAFNKLSVILRRCLDVAWSSMLTFRVLPHWNNTPQILDMIFHPVTLCWHWADQFWILAILS